MVPLQHLIQTDWTRPLALVICFYTVVATIYKHTKNREEHSEGIKGTLQETGEALLMIGCIWVLQLAMDLTVGGNYRIAGFHLHAVLDFGHFAVAIRWLTKCLLRFWP